MEFKLPAIQINKEDPFENDALSRKSSIESLSLLISNITGPFVLAIDSPWGTGKTTYLNLWKAYLEADGYHCLYFSSWEVDFSCDPLIAFLGEFDNFAKNIKRDDKGFKINLDKTKKIGTLLAKRALPVAGKIATAGILDLDKLAENAISEFVSSSINDAVDAYTAEKELNEKFHASLAKVIEDLHEESSKNKIIIFIDEIDRCRPTFAIELLERIKHLFNVKNVIFVLALDKQQLDVSLSAVYGKGINSSEYLRRFIDLEFTLPEIDNEAFTKCIFNRFGFNDFFKERTHDELQYEPSNLVELFSELSEIFNISLRTREQCFARISIATLSTPNNQFLHPHLLVILIVLKAVAPEIYKKYVYNNGTVTDVVKYIRGIPKGDVFLNEHSGIVTEAYLLAGKKTRFGDPKELNDYREIVKSDEYSEEKKQRARKIISIIDRWSVRDKTPTLKDCVDKIELTAKFT